MDVRPQERRLIELVPTLSAGRVLCTTAGRGQFGLAYARTHPQASVVCHFFDLYQLQQSRPAAQALPTNVNFDCGADFPAGPFDLVVLLFQRGGQAELAREELQMGHQRLAIGGRMFVASDQPKDHWFDEQLKKLFAKVSRYAKEDSVVYQATKTAELKKIKDYSCELAFRDGERLIHLRTRPGVFNHREVDGGARALIKSMHVEPGMRVLDLGCGSGAVAIAAASRAVEVQVQAIDSNPRAIEAVEWASQRNAAVVSTALDADGSSVAPGSMDLVLANPPYFSNCRIAALFLRIAAKALVPGGQLLLVTKTPQWYAENLPEEYDEASTEPLGQYIVLRARRS